MCGISAIINKFCRPVDESILRKMTDRIIHRGPDAEGYFMADGFGFGHRRLKITDLSDSAIQPMHKKGHTLIFNGEIYNYKELRKFLSQKGFQFNSTGDAEVILAAYLFWGQKCVEHFNGMWSFILYDPNLQILFCSRDRYGIKPFCYFETADSIFIGSEIKQFIDIPGFVPRMNQHIAFHYLYHGNINGVEQSFFENVKFLSPGTNLIFNLVNKTYALKKWYTLDQTAKSDFNYSEACTEFRNIFESSISLYTKSEVELGTALSGGLDSSSIACMYKDISPPGTKLNTISTCFHQEEHNEIHYINEVSDYIGESGNRIFPDINELFTDDALKKITYHQDQPILSGSFFSEYKLYQKAGELGLKVMLSGQGADEYLAGYDFFHYFNLMKQVQNFQFYSAKNDAFGYSKINNLPRFELLKNLGYSLMSQSYLSVKNKFSRKDKYQPWFTSRWLSDTFEEQSLTPKLSFAGNCNLKHLTGRAINSFSLPHQLHSEDRHSMMFSVESRLPFLDHRMVEFCLQLPDHFKINGGVTKKVMRDGLAGVLPEPIRQRHDKMGFPGPEDKLFEKENPVIRKQLKSLGEKFPEIFKSSLCTGLDNSLAGDSQSKSMAFRALSFYQWTNAFGINS